MAQKLVRYMNSTTFLLGPAGPRKAVGGNLDLSRVARILRDPEPSSPEPTFFFTNSLSEVRNTDLDVAASSSAIKQINETLSCAVEAKELLVAVSSLAEAFQESTWDIPQALSGYTGPPRHFGHPSRAIPETSLTLVDFDPSSSQPSFPWGYSSTDWSADSHLGSFIYEVLSVGDLSEYIRAFTLYISRLSDTVRDLHRYTLDLVLGRLLLLLRIGKSVEGFVAFSTWPRPPTRPATNYRSLSA